MNHLVDQSSPYLQQHILNPVDWYPWIDEAFEKAKRENKLIFISTGYSACHWCHVMAHESFEDQDTANYLNEYFVSIKVDREERPDIDILYQTMVQAMGRNGGWPLSIFLTPDAKPIFGGTYFPKDPRFGMISFMQLLQTLVQKYGEAEQEIISAGNKILKQLEQIYRYEMVDKTNAQKFFPFPAEFPSLIEEIYNHFDLTEGGIKGSPKFPSFNLLTFLMREIVEIRSTHPELVNKIEKLIEISLDSMANGGIYDHVGGGFHRYSVDEHWLVPHFEKMLYDNALALKVYSEAYLYFGKPKYKALVKDIIDWLNREMKHPSGGYFSSIDADSEGEEGKFYVWSLVELESNLTELEVSLMKNFFGVSKEGNFETDLNVLHKITSISALSDKLHTSPVELSLTISEIKDKLRKIRNTRTVPNIDKKIILSWNSLIMKGLLSARRIFLESPFADQLLQTVTSLSAFIRKKMIEPTIGRVYRIYRRSIAKIPGMLDDYAYLIQVLLDEYDITHDSEVLKSVEQLFEYVNHHFWDKDRNLYYYTEDFNNDIPVRPVIMHDNPLPNPNAIMAENLLRFHFYFSSSQGLEQADGLIRELIPHIQKSPLYFASCYLAIQCMVYGGTDINIIHPPGQFTKNNQLYLRNIVSHVYIPRLHIYEGPCCPKNPTKKTFNEKVTFYHCKGFDCDSPTTNFEEFIHLLEKEHKKLVLPE